MRTLAPDALLVLEDGTHWPGHGFGAEAPVTGEVVFNTSQTGYQEILSDPSYTGQLVTLTTPHVGNTGVNHDDLESDRVRAAALLCRAVSPVVSSWRATADLPGWLGRHGVPGLAGLDTRALVLHLRREGTMRGALGRGRAADPQALLAAARACPVMSGRDLTGAVTCAEPYAGPPPQGPRRWRVVAYDFGLKRSLLRELARRGCVVTVVPASTPAAAALAERPDGVFLSNGPGDPAATTGAVAVVRELLGQVPLFGVCLGHQLLALAVGARTEKLKFGHRGGNHPVRELASGRVEISAHNHGFAVQTSSLPESVQITHVSLDDGCCEGLALPDQRAFSVQYHPESSPGPHDSGHHFDRFVELMRRGPEVRRAQA
jgi:carbamoyl-phosphate synthase small subunit